MMRVCQRQRRHLWESLREWLLVPPFTRAFLKSPSSRGLSAIAELLVEMTYQKVVKIFSKSLVLNPSKWVHILRSVITVIQFPDPRVWSILSHCWTSSVNDVRFWQQWRGTINIKQPWKIIRTFYVFFENPKNMTFLRFLSCCTRFLEHCVTVHCTKSTARDVGRNCWRGVFTFLSFPFLRSPAISYPFPIPFFPFASPLLRSRTP